ncbi:amidohydrolase family protein [Isoptericola sp. NPDC058082]|uniref:amidohydrolase family protein n=1 Tax=Isoptericola sp. NPDC058082 TaxID=3346331 RepID=UPI0036E94E49
MDAVTLLTHATVVTVDPQRTIHQDGAVAISGRHVLAVGKTADLEVAYPDATRVDARGQMVLPGFVNLHVHCAIGVTRGIGDDMGGAPIYRRDIPQGVMMSPDDTLTMSRLGAMQALAMGSTTIVENYIHAESNVEALAEVGIRAVVSERVHDADLFSVRHGQYTYDEARGRRLLAANARLIEDWHGYDDGRITCHVGPHGPDTASPDLLRRARALADEAGVGMFVHLGQSAGEVDQVHALTGRGSVEHLADVGVLGPDLVAGHCAFLGDGEAQLLADSGATVCHLPAVNAKSGWIAPVPELRRLGARVGLGTDNMAHDMIEAMRFAVAVNRVAAADAGTIRAMDALEMATIQGARALGREHELGSIEPGKLADLILVDLDGPHVAPVLDPVASMVYAGHGSDVRSVLVGGRFVVRDHEVLTVDARTVVADAQKRAEHLWAHVAGWAPADGPTGHRC